MNTFIKRKANYFLVILSILTLFGAIVYAEDFPPYSYYCESDNDCPLGTYCYIDGNYCRAPVCTTNPELLMNSFCWHEYYSTTIICLWTGNLDDVCVMH